MRDQAKYYMVIEYFETSSMENRWAFKCNSHFNSLIQLGLQNVRSLNAPGRWSSVVSVVFEFDIFVLLNLGDVIVIL